MVATCMSDCICGGDGCHRASRASRAKFSSASACLNGQHFQPVGTEIILANADSCVYFRTLPQPHIEIVDLESRS
jgi:hypothetical protein